MRIGLNETAGRKPKLDPRTKLLLLLVIGIFVLGGTGGSRMQPWNIVLCLIPLFLLALDRKWRLCLTYILVYTAGYSMHNFLLPEVTGIAGFLLLAVSGILTRFLPGVMMGQYVLHTTTISEFVAAMERIHMTEKITIPLSVIFRFLPTVQEEYRAIGDAMRMRGIRLGGGKPGKMVEYRIVPMMTCSVKIGEELSAAALTRGLGAPIKRTNICEIGFGLLDIVVLSLCIVILLYWFVGVIGIT